MPEAAPRTRTPNRVGRLLLVVNGRASGIEDPDRTAAELGAVLAEIGAPAGAVVTRSEDELRDALRAAVAAGSRAALVGGDGSLHAAANAPLSRLPELALVPAGRANNIARALGVPTDRARALAVAADAPARALDALRVETPERALYAVEAVSAGFQAAARSAYEGDNSADLRQGLGALARTVRDFDPYRIRVRLDTRPAAPADSRPGADVGRAAADLASSAGAQLFLSNLPYFGFGFEVAPGADPADGLLEAILLEAPDRRRLLRLLASAYRGRHLGRPGVHRVAARHAELTEPLPLVADAVPLGTTTAAVSVEPGRLRVAAPGGGR